MDIKDYALQYLNKGLSVIPLKSPAMVNPDLPEKEFIRQCKIPLVPWKPFQERRPTEQEVSDWFDKWPSANIGIVTGKISNLVVFDLDSDNGVQYAEDEGGFPDTPKVRTGRGYHYYLRHPGFEVRNDVRKELDIDIRADGGYAAAPPSVHGSGRDYEWEDNSSIFDIDPAPCESWMIHYLEEVATPAKTSAKKSKKTKAENNSAKNSTGSKDMPEIPQRTNTVKTDSVNDQYTDIMKTGAQEGQRNQTATKLAGHLFAKGLAADEVWEIMKDWNESKNAPPLDEDELQRTFVSIRDMEASKEKPKKPEINAESFLDTPEKVISQYKKNYVRIPFADTHLNALQAKMNGGLAGGCLYILGGIPSSGKTCLANNLADNICLQNHPVLFFSCDDGATELRYRTYSRFSGFEIENFNRRVISKSDIEAIAKNEHLTRINPCKYVVSYMINIEDWPKLLSQIKSCHQKAPVIIIDYLRKLRTNDQQADERLRIDGILSQLTELAKKHKTPVIAISELARDSYKSGQRLSMASFKESGSIEYEASWLGILAAVEENGVGYTLKNDWERIINHDGNIDLIVFKAKRGTGETGKISLKMYKSKMTFRDRIESGKLDTVQQMTKSKYD